MAVQKLSFYLARVHILGTHRCGKTCCDSFKRRAKFQDVSCRGDYSERVLASFVNQIKSEYYGGNKYVSIEGILLDNFSPIYTDIEKLSHA